MTEPLNRDDIITLLQRLGADDDTEVLEAARALHTAVADAGTSWEELLVPEDAGDAGAEADGGDAGAEADDGVDEDVAETPAPADAKGQKAKARALIGKLLARPNITEAFREEMEGYKADIAEGDFTDADYKYLCALAKRLSGKG